MQPAEQPLGMQIDQPVPLDSGQPSTNTATAQQQQQQQPPAATGPEATVRLESITRSLPQSYPFEGSRYYERSCYEAYYNYVNDALDEGIKIITVTGTPGIGKSVFYLQFFQKYRHNNPTKTIVTASFNKKRKLKKCMVYKAGQEGVLHDKIPIDIKDAIHFYDGPPELEPEDYQMVTFTSPNEEWLETVQRYNKYRILYMPFWTLNELIDAKDFLNLDLDDDEIERRYKLYGGSARICLGTWHARLKVDASSMNAAIDAIDSYEKVKAYLKINPQSREISQKIFFYVPVFDQRENYPQEFQYYFCSLEVAKLVHENIMNKTNEKRTMLVNWFKGNPESASFLGWMFEGYCKEVFSNGGAFTLVPLFDQASTSEGATGNIELQIPAENGYIHADKKNYESIDGYYYDESRKELYLFQMTFSYTHPVKGAGLIAHLTNTGFDRVAGLKINLVFVVSKSMDEFKEQEIERQSPLTGDSHVSQLSGIGKGKSKALHGLGIITLNQLQEAVKGGLVSNYYKTVLDKYAKIEQESGRLDTIRQYLLVTDVEYKL